MSGPFQEWTPIVEVFEERQQTTFTEVGEEAAARDGLLRSLPNLNL